MANERNLILSYNPVADFGQLVHRFAIRKNDTQNIAHSHINARAMSFFLGVTTVIYNGVSSDKYLFLRRTCAMHEPWCPMVTSVILKEGEERYE